MCITNVIQVDAMQVDIIQTKVIQVNLIQVKATQESGRWCRIVYKKSGKFNDPVIQGGRNI